MGILLRGGTVVNHDGSERADVLTDGERVVAVGLGLDAPAGTEVIDAGGCLVMPGGIDPHTHLEFPFMDQVSADDFEVGTMAALSGGTTGIIDFCVPAPGQPLLDAMADWRRKSAVACCDYGFHVAVTWWGEGVSEDMGACVRDHGVNSFKHFMAYKGALMVNDEEMIRSFARCAELGAMPMVHAENGDMVHHLQAECFAKGLTGPEAHAWSRPPEVEGEAAARAAMIAAMTGVPLYVVHTSCREAHEAIARARATGQRVYGEALIQHLTLDSSEYLNPDWDHASDRVMSPPFRDAPHQDSLWGGLAAGSIQVVATDHCAFSREQKRIGRDDFRRIPNGTGGIEDRMRVLWTAGVGTGRISPEDFVAVTSANPARIFNLFPRKGAVRVGADADLVVWDLAAEATISAARQVSRAGGNVFEGMRCTGLPVATILRGGVAWRDGVAKVGPGHGRYVPRAPFHAPVGSHGPVARRRAAHAPVPRFELVP